MEGILVDINCDVGEGIGKERALLPLISSCNIACGGHTGDETSMQDTVRLALRHNVKIGAHPSYPDKHGFGRVSITISPEDLKQSIRGQVFALATILSKGNIALHHIKPHGALYNDIAKDPSLAKVFLAGIADYRTKVYLYVPFASEIEKEALRQGFRIKYEAFADRNYNADLSLVSRKQEQALIVDERMVLEHILEMINNKSVSTLSGEKAKILADTFCIHSDTPLAFKIVSYITEELPKHNIRIKK